MRYLIFRLALKSRKDKVSLMAMFSPTSVSCRSPSIDDFAFALAFPQKNCAQDFYGMIEARVQYLCCTRKLLEYAESMSSVIASKDFDTLEELIKKKIFGIFLRIQEKLYSREELFKKKVSSWVHSEEARLRVHIVRRFAPFDAEDLCSFIVKKGLKIVDQENPGGKSVRKEFFTQKGKRLVVTYRLREGQVQVLVHESVRSGAIKTFQKVAVVAGPLVQGAPGPIFARLKMNPLCRCDPAVRNIVRQEASISQAMRQSGVRNIVEYAIISRKREGTTLATTLYGADLWDLLNAFPHGADSPDAVRLFLSDIAIPISMALADLHQRKVAHLDLKSENIFLSEQGKAVLGDFGTYRMMSWTEKQVITTPACTAPEIFEQPSWPVTPALDIWAFGLVLTELFVE